MSVKCDICGKGALRANTISHAHNVTRTKQMPNLQTVSIIVSGNRRKVKACTRCLKAGKIYAKA